MPHKVEEWPDEKLFKLIDRLYAWDTRQDGHKYKEDHKNQLFAALRSPLIPKRVLERYVVDRFLTDDDPHGLHDVQLFCDWLHVHGYAIGEHEWSGHRWKRSEYQAIRQHSNRAFELAVQAHDDMSSALDQVGLTERHKQALLDLMNEIRPLRALIAGVPEPED
jgi:hypothetical protein